MPTARGQKRYVLANAALDAVQTVGWFPDDGANSGMLLAMDAYGVPQSRIVQDDTIPRSRLGVRDDGQQRAEVYEKPAPAREVTVIPPQIQTLADVAGKIRAGTATDQEKDDALLAAATYLMQNWRRIGRHP